MHQLTCTYSCSAYVVCSDSQLICSKDDELVNHRLACMRLESLVAGATFVATQKRMVICYNGNTCAVGNRSDQFPTAVPVAGNPTTNKDIQYQYQILKLPIAVCHGRRRLRPEKILFCFPTIYMIIINNRRSHTHFFTCSAQPYVHSVFMGGQLSRKPPSLKMRTHR